MSPGISEYGVITRLRDFVKADSPRIANGIVISDDDKLDFDPADSLRIARMIAFIEGEFGVYVSNNEVIDENFGSLRAVARFVANRQPFAVG